MSLTTRGTARLIDIADEYKKYITSQMHWLTDPSRRRGPEGIADVVQDSTLMQRGKLGEYVRLHKKFEKHIAAIKAKNLSDVSGEQKESSSAPPSPMPVDGPTLVTPGRSSTDLAKSKPKIETDEQEDIDMQIALEFLPKQEELMREAARLFYFNRYQSPWHAQSWKRYLKWGTIDGSIPGVLSQPNIIDKISLILRQIFQSTISDPYGRATSVAVVDPNIAKTAPIRTPRVDSRRSRRELKDPEVDVEQTQEPLSEQKNEDIHFAAVDDFNVFRSMTNDQDSKPINSARLTQGTQSMLDISKFFIDNIAKQKQLLISKKKESWWIGAWNIDTQAKQPTMHGKLALYEQLEKLFRSFNNTVYLQPNTTRELEDKRLVELQELIRLASLVYSMRRIATEAQSWKDYKTWGSDIGTFSKDHTDPISVKLRQVYLQTLSDREGRAIRIFDNKVKTNVTVDNDALLRRLMTDEYVEAKKKSITPQQSS